MAVRPARDIDRIADFLERNENKPLIARNARFTKVEPVKDFDRAVVYEPGDTWSGLGDLGVATAWPPSYEHEKATGWFDPTRYGVEIGSAGIAFEVGTTYAGKMGGIVGLVVGFFCGRWLWSRRRLD